MTPSFKQAALFFVSQDIEICEAKLACLLYYSQGLHLAGNGKPLFDEKIYATNAEPSFGEEGDTFIEELLQDRDFTLYYLRLAYYFVGYLEFFKND